MSNQQIIKESRHSFILFFYDSLNDKLALKSVPLLLKTDRFMTGLIAGGKRKPGLLKFLLEEIWVFIVNVLVKQES